MGSVRGGGGKCKGRCGKVSWGVGNDGGSISKVGGPKPMTRFSSPTTIGVSGVARNFKKERGHNYIFSIVFFSAELI